MKAEINGWGGSWRWELTLGGKRAAVSPQFYSRRSDAKRGLIRFLKGMKKGVEVPE